MLHLFPTGAFQVLDDTNNEAVPVETDASNSSVHETVLPLEQCEVFLPKTENSGMSGITVWLPASEAGNEIIRLFRQ